MKAYFGFCSATIQAISAGTRVINTKFLRSSIRNKKIQSHENSFP